MIRFGTSIRLTSDDQERLCLLTGVRPVGINSVEAMNRFIEQQSQQHHTGTPEGKLLTLLLDDERVQD